MSKCHEYTTDGKNWHVSIEPTPSGDFTVVIADTVRHHAVTFRGNRSLQAAKKLVHEWLMITPSKTKWTCHR